MKLDFHDCTQEIAYILKNIIKFKYLLEKEFSKLYYLYASILYFAIAINRNDNKYSQIYFVKFTCSKLKNGLLIL